MAPLQKLGSQSLTEVVVAKLALAWPGAALVLVAPLAPESVAAHPLSRALNAALDRAVLVQMLSHLAARFTDGVRVLKLKSLHHTHRIVLLRILHRFFIHRALLFMIRRFMKSKTILIFYNMLLSLAFVIQHVILMLYITWLR